MLSRKEFDLRITPTSLFRYSLDLTLIHQKLPYVIAYPEKFYLDSFFDYINKFINYFYSTNKLVKYDIILDVKLNQPEQAIPPEHYDKLERLVRTAISFGRDTNSSCFRSYIVDETTQDWLYDLFIRKIGICSTMTLPIPAMLEILGWIPCLNFNIVNTRDHQYIELMDNEGNYNIYETTSEFIKATTTSPVIISKINTEIIKDHPSMYIEDRRRTSNIIGMYMAEYLEFLRLNMPKFLVIEEELWIDLLKPLTYYSIKTITTEQIITNMWAIVENMIALRFPKWGLEKYEKYLMPNFGLFVSLSYTLVFLNVYNFIAQLNNVEDLFKYLSLYLDVITLRNIKLSSMPSNHVLLKFLLYLDSKSYNKLFDKINFKLNEMKKVYLIDETNVIYLSYKDLLKELMNINNLLKLINLRKDKDQIKEEILQNYIVLEHYTHFSYWLRKIYDKHLMIKEITDETFECPKLVYLGTRRMS